MKIQAGKILLFPIDTVTRELEWQLFIALEAARKFETTSIIGHKYVITQVHKNSKNCVWLGRLSTNHGRGKIDKKIIELGNLNKTKFLYLHDEGAFYYKHNYKKSIEQIHPLETATISDNFKFLMWGKYQKNIIEKVSKSRNLNIKITTTGMPRFDLYNDTLNWWDNEQVEKIKEKYGEFVLVNTNFGNSNSNEHPAGLITEHFLRANKILRDKKRKHEYFERWKKDHDDFSSFTLMLNYVIESLPSYNFLIRPHPSENSEFYRKVFGYLDNVLVLRDGDVRPWIKASKAMIHNDCTTGLEGCLAEKRVINYKPANKNEFDILIASEAGISTKTPKEVVAYLQSKLGVEQSFGKQEKEKLLNIDQISTELILNEISNNNESIDLAEVIIDHYLLRKLKRLKQKYFSYKINKKGIEIGREVRLSKINSDMVLKKVNNYNNHFNCNISPKLVESNLIVL